MEALLSHVLSPRFLAQARPIVVALIAIALCLLIFRPKKPPQATAPRGRQPGGGTGAAAGAAAGAGGPAVCISTRGILLDFDGTTPRMLPGAVSALLRIAERADIYLVTTLPQDSDAIEAATLEAMAAAGIFADGVCARCKALFCATEDGRSAIVRQLAPAVHLDTSPKVLGYLAPHLPRVVYVHAAGAAPDGVTAGSVLRARSLTDYADATARGASEQSAGA